MRSRRHTGDPGGSTLVLDDGHASPPPLEREVWFWLLVLLVLVVAAVVGGWFGLQARPGKEIAQRPPAAATRLAGEPDTTTRAAPAAPIPTPSSATVPDVSGQRFPDARKALRDAGLVADQQRVFSSAPKHTVVGQSPPSGATVTPGDHVLLAVSSGPAKEHGPHGKDDEQGDSRNQ